MPTQTSINNEFKNNLTVVENDVGNAAILYVYNTDNTNAASHAQVLVSTGGASAGDAYVHFTNNVVDVTMGLDNSDSDAFVISGNATPGTSNRAKCLTTGEWTYPLQPGFSAYKNGDAANVTGAGTAYAVVQGTERFDSVGNFSTVAGAFTAPVTGKYLLSVTNSVKGTTIATNLNTVLSTSNRNYFFVISRPACAQAACSGGSVIADMDAADTAYTYVIGYGEAADTDDYWGSNTVNQLSGVLLQ